MGLVEVLLVAPPTILLVQQSRKLELIINLDSEVSFEVPRAQLSRADEVIE